MYWWLARLLDCLACPFERFTTGDLPAEVGERIALAKRTLRNDYIQLFDALDRSMFDRWK